MRRLAPAILLLALSASVWPADWSKWVDPDKAFSLHFPAGWVVSSEGGMVSGASRATHEELRVIPVWNKPDVTAQDLAEELLASLRAAGVEDLKVESWRETEDPEHLASAEVSYREDGARYLGVLFLNRQDGGATAFTYTVRGDDYTPERASVLLQGLVTSLADGEDSADPNLDIPPLGTGAGPRAPQAGAVGEVTYTPPARWTSAERDGGVVMTPPDADGAAAVLVVLLPAAELADQTFRAWFEANLAATIAPPAKVLQEAPIEVGERSGLDLLTAVRAIQDDGGVARLQLCYAISDGARAALVVGLAANDAAVEKYGDALSAFLGSLDFAGRTPPPPADTTPSAGEGQGEPVPTSSLVNGRPQGLFVGVSVLSGNPASMLFLDDGRVYHGIPTAGLNRVDWQQLQAEHSNLCSRWEVQGGTLRILWPDGNVWESPLEPTATGFSFNGKQYGATYPVDLGHLAGSWEGTKSTAWLNVGYGPAMTQINSLQVAGDGGYSWGVATGGDVEGATAYSEAAFAGRVEIDGYEAVFHAGDGKSRRLSVVRWTDPDTLILGGAFYFRK